MELVVYIAIMGIIVIVAGQAFSNSTKFRVRNQSMIEANEVAGNIAALIRDDVAQMGAKSSLEKAGTGGASDQFSGKDTSDLVYMDLSKADSSSFTLTTTKEGNSTLKFRRIHYSNEENKKGTFVNVEEVTWFLDGDVLKRKCTVAGSTSTPCAEGSVDDVEIADGVAKFSIIAGKPKVNDEDQQMFPSSGDAFSLVPRFGENRYNFMKAEPADEGSIAVLTGFVSNFDKEANNADEAAGDRSKAELNQLYAKNGYTSDPSFNVSDWSNKCNETGNNFTFKPGMVYEISFELEVPTSEDKMGAFRPGRDYLAVGFRKASGDTIGRVADFQFYPPIVQATEAPKRSMRFSVDTTITKACMAFTFVSYSPIAHEGTLKIKNLKLKQLATANYDFTTWDTEIDANIAEKKNVKAFKLNLSIKVNGEEGMSEEIISVPSNGPRD